MTGDESLGVLDVLLAIAGLGFSLLLFGSFVWWIVFKVRRRREDIPTAMRAYADERGLAFEGDGTLPRVTPLLKRGGVALGTVSGTLAPGVEGRLAQYRYDIGKQDRSYLAEQAVVLAPLPEVGSTRMYLDRRLAGTGGAVADALGPLQEVRIESTHFGERYRLRVRDEASMVAVRQLFSPSFIVFLNEEAPEGFSFELENGQICAALHGAHWRDPAKLDELCRATATVCARIRADVAERLDLRAAVASRPPPPPPPPPPA